MKEVTENLTAKDLLNALHQIDFDVNIKKVGVKVELYDGEGGSLADYSLHSVSFDREENAICILITERESEE